MKKLIPFFPAAVMLILLVAAVATTLEDFFLPGSQIGQSGNIETPDRCDNCHGGYDAAIEPAFNWRGSMMSQAARDPLFYACLAIANQDAPGVGDMCLRCHTPDGWLNGRCDPTDGSALNNNDRQGVQCDFCHKMVKPTPLGTNPYPGDANYFQNTVFGVVAYNQDQAYLTKIIPLPGTSANGMYIADVSNAKRGPFVDATGRHQMIYSPFHQDAALCGTCHDVSNPVYDKQTDGSYLPNTMNTAHPTQYLRDMFPVERTYSEWKASGFNDPGTASHKTCQDCHMKDVTGKAAKMNDAVLRTNLPLHDMTGGNTFTPKMVKQKWTAEVNAAALDAGILRSQAQLKSATTLTLAVDPVTKVAIVKITNNTGHKFPTGYPEGRRAWINLVAYDASNAMIYESGAYNIITAELMHHSTLYNNECKIYHCEPGLSDEIAAATGLPAGVSFHFALNNKIFFDNRIPPAGFTNAGLITNQSPVVGATYPDGQNFDVTTYSLPSTTTRVVANLYYQTTSKEYVEFLKSENKTNTAGQELYDLWVANGKSAPELINTATWGTGGTTVKYLIAKFNSTVTRTTSAKTGTYASANVLVTSIGTPVTGATVSYSYTGPNSGTATGITSSNGVVTLKTKAMKNPIGTWCFTLNNVALTGYTYEIPKPLTRLCENEVLPSSKSAIIPQIQAEASLTIYPNPAPGKAHIDYTIAGPGLTVIAIYNSLGQQVTILVNKFLNEGKYFTEWDGTGFPEGVYICRLATGDRMINKTIILKK